MTLFQDFIITAKGPITKIIDKSMQLGVGMNIVDKAGQIPGVVDGEAFEVFLKQAAAAALLFVNGLGISVKESGKLL